MNRAPSSIEPLRAVPFGIHSQKAYGPASPKSPSTASGQPSFQSAKIASPDFPGGFSALGGESSAVIGLSSFTGVSDAIVASLPFHPLEVFVHLLDESVVQLVA